MFIYPYSAYELNLDSFQKPNFVENSLRLHNFLKISGHPVKYKMIF